MRDPRVKADMTWVCGGLTYRFRTARCEQEPLKMPELVPQPLEFCMETSTWKPSWNVFQEGNVIHGEPSGYHDLCDSI